MPLSISWVVPLPQVVMGRRADITPKNIQGNSSENKNTNQWEQGLWHWSKHTAELEDKDKHSMAHIIITKL